jgi:hypothetical protein
MLMVKDILSRVEGRCVLVLWRRLQPNVAYFAPTTDSAQIVGRAFLPAAAF